MGILVSFIHQVLYFGLTPKMKFYLQGLELHRDRRRGWLLLPLVLALVSIQKCPLGQGHVKCIAGLELHMAIASVAPAHGLGAPSKASNRLLRFSNGSFMCKMKMALSSER